MEREEFLNRLDACIEGEQSRENLWEAVANAITNAYEDGFETGCEVVEREPLVSFTDHLGRQVTADVDGVGSLGTARVVEASIREALGEPVEYRSGPALNLTGPPK